MKKNILKRALSLVLCIVLVASYLPTGILPAVAVGIDSTTRATDPSTLDQWKQYFGAQTNHNQNVELTTEFAGGVWTDKSVFQPGDDISELTRAQYSGNSFTFDDTGDNFLVSLSAIASNKQIKGYSTIPTDTVLILDLSSSMRYTGDNRSSAVDELADATNAAITELMALNSNNRVAVVLYAGTHDATWAAKDGKTTVLLPLDSYTTTNANGKFVEATRNAAGTANYALQLVAGVKDGNGNAVSNRNTRFDVSTGTFAQDGLYVAMQQLLNANPVVEEGFQAGVSRIPIMVLMSDGEPTLANENYYGTYTTSGGKKTFTDLGNSNLYNYDGTTNGTRNRDTIAFLTSLTAAFAKKQITAHYSEQGLMYTLSYGNTVTTLSEAKSLLNPKDASAVQNDMWNRFLNNETVTVYQSGSRTLTTKNSTDPDLQLTTADRYYVDGYYAATDDAAMRQAFDAIVDEIELQSRYYPTYVENDHNHDGYLTFVDKIGSYMEVSDIKGIVIGDRLFSGAALAEGLTQTNLGTPENPTDFGNKFVNSVRTRLNIENLTTAQTLIANAYSHGQLSYTSPTEFSHYIGWFSDADGNFVDFWHEGLDPADYPTAANGGTATHIMRSYGFLGDTTVIPGVPNTDMMYMTVRVATEIATGESIITWKIPASLIPTVTYDVEVDVDSNGNLTQLRSLALANNSAQDPIRLVYEVALRSDITEWNVLEKTGGTTTFYSNKYDSTNPSATALNTYSHFEPSTANERYYYTSDHLICSDMNGTVYTGAKPTSGTYYHQFLVYEKLENGSLRIHEHYEPITAASLALAESAGNNQWVIPKGTVLRYQDDVTTLKTQNLTDTMAYSDHPEIVAEGEHYYTYSTQGNNGKLTVTPATGIKLTKELTETVDGAANSFTFTIPVNKSGVQVVRLDANGNEASREEFNGTVTLTAGETVYIIGLEPGDYSITEEAHDKYSVTAVTVNDQLQNGTAANVTLTAQQIADVEFTNAPKGYGNLEITKEVRHAQAGHTVPASMLDQTFPITVTVPAELAGDDVVINNGTGDVNSKVPAGGIFTFDIKHGQTIAIKGLPEGTVATASEGTVSAPFAFERINSRDHSGAELDNDGKVTIAENGNATAIIHNKYQPASTTADLDVKVTKNFIVESALTQNATFTFQVQAWNGEVDSWMELADGHVFYYAELANDKYGGTKELTITDVLKNITYTEAGDYAYRVIEKIPDNKLPGVTYDRTVWAFTVHVADNNGQLAVTIKDNSKPEPSNTITGTFEVSFENTAHRAPVSIDVVKELNITSGSNEIAKSGFLFAAYEADANFNLLDDTADLTVRSDAAGHARFAATYDQVGTHYFVVKEVNEGKAGWIYDKTEYRIRVDINDPLQDGDLKPGIMIRKVTYNEAGEATVHDPVPGAAPTITFKNTYDPTDAAVDLDTAVRKNLEGRTLNAGEFTFAVYENGKSTDPNATPKLTGTNAADGSVDFNGVLTFDKIGVYEYDIVELTGNLGGVTYDSRIYDLVVEVTDNGSGQLSARYYFEDAPTNTVTFTNTYSAKEVSHVVDGTKAMTGRPLLLGGFTFRMTEVADENGSFLTGARSWTAENGHADSNNTAAFRFPAITYTETGTHYYKIEEVNTGALGVAYDRNTYVIKVEVTDNGRGQLEASQTIVSGGNAILFSNSYTPLPITTNLISVKKLNGKVLTAGQFSFTITQTQSDFATEVDGGLNATVSNGADGLIQFPDITFTGNDTRYYVIKEVNGGQTIDGIIYDDTVYHVTITATDNQLGSLVLVTDIKAVVGNEEASASSIVFSNEYVVTGGASLILSGEKTYTDGNLTDGKFTFELYETGNSTPIATADNAGNTYTIRLNYTAANDLGKTYSYVLKEKNAGQTIDGTTYASTEYQITVKVLDDDKGGIKLEVTTSSGQQSTTDKVTTVTGLNFENSYSATPTSVALSGTKALTAPDGSASIRQLKANDFTFQLYATGASFAVGTGDAPIATAKNGNPSTGEFTFGSVPLNTAGEHYFVVRESNDIPIGGVTYDNAEYRITVTVGDEGKGQLKVDSVVYQKVTAAGTTTENSIVFTNTYDPADATVAISGKKTLEGRNWKTGDSFTFALQETDDQFNALAGTTPAEKVNSADGSFAFDQLTFDAPGTYYYTVTEKAGDPNVGITYDDAIYKIKIVVTDDKNGKLIPTVTVNGSSNNVSVTDTNATVTNVNFLNRYAAKATLPVHLTGGKTLFGDRELKKDDFTFQMFKADAQFNIQGAAYKTVKNDENGSFIFQDIIFDTAGIHRFVIKESSENPIKGMTYDSTVYHLIVEVTDDLQGQLMITDAKLEKITDEGAVDVIDLTFTNHYDAEDATLSLSGKKVLKGKALTDGEFTFQLVQADDKFVPMTGQGVIPSQTVNKGESFTFDALTYDTVGTYYYVVTEVNTGNERTTFDESVYHVTVTVTDEGGVLKAVATYEKGGKAASEMVFTNVYTPKPADLPITFQVQKTVKNIGKETIGPEGFTFVLEENADAKLEATTDKDGKVSFNLTATEDMIGQTYKLKLYEKNDGKANVTYSDKVYELTVTIRLDSDNKLVADLTVDGKAVKNVNVAFENVYDYTIPATPHTGDNTPVVLLFSLLAISGMAMAAAVIFRKKILG